MLSLAHTGLVIGALIGVPHARRATKIIDPGLTIVATRRHKSDRRSRTEEFTVTIGKPNYANRKLIKMMKKAKEPFPIKNVQLQYWPKAA